MLLSPPSQHIQFHFINRPSLFPLSKGSLRAFHSIGRHQSQSDKHPEPRQRCQPIYLYQTCQQKFDKGLLYVSILPIPAPSFFMAATIRSTSSTQSFSIITVTLSAPRLGYLTLYCMFLCILEVSLANPDTVHENGGMQIVRYSGRGAAENYVPIILGSRGSTCMSLNGTISSASRWLELMS